MNETVVPGPVEDGRGIREAVCIHTKKVYDSCKDRDCLEDLRVYPTRTSQAVLDRALSVRGGKAELLQAYLDVEPASYNRGYFTVDIRCYYHVTADAFVGGPRPTEICGLAVFDKRVLLFGSQGNAKIFSSRYALDEADPQNARRSNLPEAVLEAVDPIVLNLKMIDPSDCLPPCPPPPCGPMPPFAPPCGPAQPPHGGGAMAGTGMGPEAAYGTTPGCTPENELSEIPPAIAAAFDCPLSLDNGPRRLYVTLGQFSIVRLERDTQLLIPMYDYCLPTRECSAGDDGQEDPCELFRQIRFLVGEFYPPNTLPGMEEEEGGSTRPGCGCGC